eukprot:gene6332-7702_t
MAELPAGGLTPDAVEHATKGEASGAAAAAWLQCDNDGHRP